MGKDCGNHGACKRHKMYRMIGAWVICIILVILLIILIVWVSLRPHKPTFYLHDAAVVAFNLSGPTLLTSLFQVTISTRNPNDMVGIRYDKLDAYAEYKNQQITLPTAIPPVYQGHKDVEVWSPFLQGVAVPIAPFLAGQIMQDERAGLLLMKVKMDGRLKWKVGSWTSSHYHINVECPAWLTIDGSKGTGCAAAVGGCAAPAIRFQQMTTCSVDV